MKPKISTKYGDLFQDWKFCPLTDVVFFQEGPGLRKWQFTDSGMKVINVANILLDGTVDTSNSSRHIPLEEYEQKYQHFAIEADDTVVSSSGWSYGKVGRIKAKHLPLMMNTSVIRFHPLSERTLDSSYLHKFLCSSFFRRQIEAYIIGSHQPNFGPSHIKRMKIVVPPFPIQRKIASILSAYDDLIENNTRRIAILEEMAEAIYREWFVNFRFPGHENVKLVDSPLGQIPEGWSVVTVGDIARRHSESVTPSKFPEENFEHFSLPAFDVNALPDLEVGSSIKSNKTVVTGDSVLLSKLNPRIPRIWLPFPSEDNRSITSTEFMVMRGEGVSREFLFSVFRSDDFHDRFSMCSGGTSTSHQRVKPPVFLKLPIVLPPSEQLEKFQPLIQPLLHLAQNQRIKIENLRQTRDVLLPKLISGKLDVEDLDIDLVMTTEALEEATV